MYCRLGVFRFSYFGFLLLFRGRGIYVLVGEGKLFELGKNFVCEYN